MTTLAKRIERCRKLTEELEDKATSINHDLIEGKALGMRQLMDVLDGNK